MLPLWSEKKEWPSGGSLDTYLEGYRTLRVPQKSTYHYLCMVGIPLRMIIKPITLNFTDTYYNSHQKNSKQISTS